MNAELVLDEIEEFLTGARPAPAQDRILATVLFTDIVGSTDLAARLGDQRWLDLRAAHDELVRIHLDRYRGKDIATTGMDSWQPSTAQLAQYDAPRKSPRRSDRWGSRFERDCTAAKSRSRTDRSPGSRSTSPRG